MSIFRSLFTIAAMLLILSTNIIAQEGPQTLPDDPLYQAKRQIETAQLNAEIAPLEKATLHTKYAKERLAELKAVVSKGKSEFLESLIKDYGKAIDGAMEEIKKAQTQGKDVSKALEAVEKSTKKHTEILTDLLRKVPEHAKPAITHAIEVSRHGRNRALDVLNKIQKHELPIGKPEDVGKPQGIGRPEGAGRLEGVGKPESTGRPTKIPAGRFGDGRDRGR